MACATISPSPQWYISQYGGSVNGSIPTANTWYYIVLTESANSWTLSINNTVYSGTMTANTVLGNFYIGRGGSLIEWWQGIVDEVRVRNDVETSSQITAEYNNGNNPGNIGSPGFITYTLNY